MCNILWNEKSVQKVHTVHKTLLLLEVSWEYTTSTTSDFLLHYVQSADFFIMYNILWNEKLVQKVHTVHKTLLLLEVSWEYTTSTTSDFLLHYVQSALERKVGAKFYTVPETLLSISSFVHNYPNIQMSTSLLSLPVTSLQTSVSVVLVPTTVFAQKIHTVPETLLSISSFVHKYPKCQHHCYHCQWLHFKLRFLWSWCLPQFLHKKFTLCPKLYFPYHHLYTNIQNVNIIAIIASDFTSNFGFCGLGAYHSFCTKNSQTLLSISSFVHKYPKCQHHCYHCQWLHFKLRFLWSWCLPQFLHCQLCISRKLLFVHDYYAQNCNCLRN